MTKPERDYYPLPLAASIIGCTTDDLIHWAANDRVRLGVLFEINSLLPEYYTCFRGDPFRDENIVATPVFSGFAYVYSHCFMGMERDGGELEFQNVETLDGLHIMNNLRPSENYFGTDYRPVDRIFIHRTNLLPLVAEANESINTQSAATSRAHVSDNLALLNQAAQKWWGNADRDDRSTHPTKSDVVAWLMEHGFSQITAESGATIIKPEWAGIGRKPRE